MGRWPAPPPGQRSAEPEKALGGQDIELGGDHEFDEFFVIKGKEPALVRRLWTAKARGILRQRLGELVKVVECRHGRLAIVLPTFAQEPNLLAAIDLAKELAERDIYGCKALRELDGNLSFSPESTPIVDVRRPHAVRLNPVVVDDTLRTMATLLEKVPAIMDPFVLRLPGDAPPPDVAPGALPSAALPFLPAVGSGQLEITSGRDAFFRFDDIVETPDRLDAAVGLLNALCAGQQQSVYR